MRRIFLSTFLALLFCGFGVAGSPGPDARTFDHSALDTILAAAVDGEQVHYSLVNDEMATALQDYLDQAARVDMDELTRDERLALLINIYNATTIRLISVRATTGYSVAADALKIFTEPRVKLRGRTVTLNQLENEIIRPTFSEPRIHVALVCGAVSCPPILPRAYTAVDLEEVLETNMSRFINDGRRNRIDVEKRVLELSSIFKWYAADFGGEEGVAAYVNRYTEIDVSGFEVRYLPYSWKLNGTLK